MSLVIAGATRYKAFVASDGRVISGRTHVRVRDDFNKIAELVPRRLILASTGYGLAIWMLQAVAREAVALYPGSDLDLFRYVSDFVGARLDACDRPYRLCADRAWWPLSAFLRWADSLQGNTPELGAELSAILVGWDGHRKAMRIHAWGRLAENAKRVFYEFPAGDGLIPSTCGVGNGMDPDSRDSLERMLARGVPPLKAFEDTIRDIGRKDPDTGGEIFTREISVVAD